MTELRGYQGDVIAAFYRTVADGKKRIILVAPTGSGKTVIAAAILGAARAAYGKAVVLAHRREIIGQNSDKLHAAAIMHGIIQAGVSPRPLEPVQVCSVQTLHARAIRTDKIELPPADLLIIDEAHHCPAATYRKIIDAYPDAVLLGLTATPCRGDGRGLGGIFETIIECPQAAALIEQKFLVPTRCYAPTTPDLVGVRTQAGDYVENQLADRMDRPKLIGDVVTNCMVLTEGWDMPEVGCAILARPTKKMGLYRQMIGRVLRPASGKADAIVIDHSGAVFRHGFAEDPVEWTLDPERRAESAKHTARCELGSKSRILECSQCGGLRIGGEPCPCCGFLPVAPPRPVPILDGDLGLVENGRAKPSEYNRYEWHAMLAHIAMERGYKPGWAAYQFKEKFGHWPQMRSIAPIEPSVEVTRWVRSRQIAYAKAKQAAGGAA
jgi:superfamily II DNA or RNA helicase